MRITRRPRAREDLLEVWGYIADDNETAADRMLDRIEQKLFMLADHP
ncbi:type II toxin-antitoxin system RelE/ParE family toxin, partial [Jiella endophytica]